jgi:hypothetical protein
MASAALDFMRHRYSTTPWRALSDAHAAYTVGKKAYNMFSRWRKPYRRAGFNKRKTFRKKPMKRRYFRKPKYNRKRSFKRFSRTLRLPAFSNKKYSQAFVTYKNVVEQAWTWTLNQTTTGTKPQFQNFTDPWLPNKGVQSEADALWDRYKVHKLKSFSWKMDNFRMFKTDHQVLAAATTPIAAPAIQVASTEQLPQWRIWYRRDHDAAAETLNFDEEQFTVKNIFSLKSSVFGKQMYRANGAEPLMETVTSAQLHGMTFDQYLLKFVVCPEDFSLAKQAQTVGIFLMPDDPLPSTIYSATRTCTLTMVNDVTTYTTFSLWDRKKDQAALRVKKHVSC